MTIPLISPDWSVPTLAQALQTTRVGGVSTGPFASFNLGDHVEDAPPAVAHNRALLMQTLPAAPCWLHQVHGSRVVDAATVAPGDAADASFTTQPGVVCVVMTADCLPILLCDAQGQVVAAVHAGWRSLCGGIVEKTVLAMTQASGVAAPALQAWLGPAIGPKAFEVGPEVRDAFLQHQPEAALAFTPAGKTFYANLYRLATQRLHASGVHAITGGDQCTYSDPQQFFSYRRDGRTGRQASLIWIPSPVCVNTSSLT